MKLRKLIKNLVKNLITDVLVRCILRKRRKRTYQDDALTAERFKVKSKLK